MSEQRPYVQAWLRRCLGPSAPELLDHRMLGRYSISVCDTDAGRVALKFYGPDDDDYSRLGPVDTGRKHALALREFPVLGVPAPHCLGFAADVDEAAVAMEWLEVGPLSPADRVDAARVLARLHATPLSNLSPDLADLVTRSTPNRDRIGKASGEPPLREPPLREATLQHGDYFSVNLASTSEGLRVLDWDLVAFGDPMWDLGFLVSADRGLAADEIGAVIAAYQECRPIGVERLAWQRRCWEEFWRERDG